jgi:hypothetical protein
MLDSLRKSTLRSESFRSDKVIPVPARNLNNPVATLYLRVARLSGIGAPCHELRVRDETGLADCLSHSRSLIVEMFRKTTRQTPDNVIKMCRRGQLSVNRTAGARDARHRRFRE